MVGIMSENPKLVTLVSVATASGLLVGALWYRKYLKNKPPTKWMKVGQLEELFVYPVKSFKGIKTSTFECTPLGPKLGVMRDRSFVVVDTEGKFVTGRDHPKMTQMEVILSGTSVYLSFPEVSGGLELDVEKIEGPRKNVQIWDTWTEGIDCGDDVARWVSRCILGEDTGLRLLFRGSDDKGKPVNGRVTSYSKMVDVQLQQSDGGFFSDGVSYHLVSDASVKELNSRLDGAVVSPTNFRPNLVIKGDMLIPFEEDNWTWLKIGDVMFQCLAPCTRYIFPRPNRCLFTTIDPNTGEKSVKMEPLASLRRYRHVRNPEKRKILTSPAMGIYLGVRSFGNICIGDDVFIPQM